jgi:hypothetical protein
MIPEAAAAVAEAAAVIVDHNTTWFVAPVAVKQLFHLSQEAIDQFIVLIATETVKSGTQTFRFV